MEPFTWTFVRGEDDEERLTIVRVTEDSGVTITVTTNGAARAVNFSDVDAARRFQSDMEKLLLNTGWSFVAFSPERRTATNSGTPPVLGERRRWWTDGMVTVKRFLEADTEEERLHRESASADLKGDSR
jgi:siroheme synthase (precorrin-2 oxidase/ferrochelatase)